MARRVPLLKRLPRRTRLFVAVFAVLYVGAYLLLRNEGSITHIENRGFASGHEVRARTDAWDELASQMLIHAPGRRPPYQTLTLRLIGRWYKFRPGVYNLVFFPLREAEKLWWNLADRT